MVSFFFLYTYLMDKCKGQLLDISPQILFETGPQNPKPEAKQHPRTKKGRIKEESESTYPVSSNLQLPPPPSKPTKPSYCTP